jgi:predicted ABC-class ATPase
MLLKRLKNYLLAMQPDNTTYKDIYEGQMVIPGLRPEYHCDSTYWRDNIAFYIERTNKLELDKPTVTIRIPINKLGVETCNSAAADYILRAFKPYIDELNVLNYNRMRPDKENGKYYIYAPNGKVLTRNTSYFSYVNQKYYILIKDNVITIPERMEQDNPPLMCINIMLQVQLPYKKHKKTIQMLTKDLPDFVNRFITDFNVDGLTKALELYQKQQDIRTWLKQSNYCAFIANGSILPRSKGTDLPLERAIPFCSTADDEIEICGVRGMGIKRGVTVITGGGYSGKSTLLDAISDGIYNHIAGDGRELVISDASAMKISAEDGRSIKNVNLSPFIKWLPNGDTADFTTEHASGSTSQAANIMEAINFDCKLLLIDEDKSATNFMIRDKMMKELIEKEPIIPFTDRVNELYHNCDVSTILVIGGSGEYLAVADKVYMMQDYAIVDVTAQSKQLCENHRITSDKIIPAIWKHSRELFTEAFTSYPDGSGTENLQVSDMGFILIGDERIDIRMLHNIASIAQLNAIAFVLRKIEVENNSTKINIEKAVDEMLVRLENDGLESVFTPFFTQCNRWLDFPRRNELLAVINRMRRVSFKQKDRD